MKKYFKTFFPQDEILGIDIGSYSIKFVLFTKEKNKIFLKNWGYQPLSIKDNMEPAEKKAIIADEISKYIKKNSIKTKYAATSVSGNSVIIRYIKIGKIDKKELESKIYTEAEAFIPFDINDVYLSNYVLNDSIYEEGQNKMEIVLVAAKKELVDDRIEVINSSGLIPVLIDVDSFAIENLINYVEDKPKDESKSIMCVNIGHRVTNLSILTNNLFMVKENPNIKPQYYSKIVRDIFVAGSSIDRAISKKMNIKEENVDEFKKTSKILLTDEDKLDTISNYDKITISSSKVITSVMKELLSDITRSIDFFVSSGIETNISKIYLSGGISSIKGINTYIYDELKIPVSFLNPFSIVENKPANITDYVSHSLSVAAGLSLRGIEDL